MALIDLFPRFPAERTDDALKSAITNNISTIAYLTCHEEKRLSAFLLDLFALRTNKDDFPIVTTLKDRTLREACRQVALPDFRAYCEAKPLAVRLDAIRIEPAAVVYLTEEQLEQNAELVTCCIRKCEGAYFGLAARTARFCEAFYFNAKTPFSLAKNFVAIPAEFQTEAMVMNAVKTDPRYFQYVAAPTESVLNALFTAHTPIPFEPLVRWIPESMNLDGMVADPDDPKGWVARIKAERKRVADEAEAKKKWIQTKLAEKAVQRGACGTCLATRPACVCSTVVTVVPTLDPNDKPALERFETDWMLAQLTKPANAAVLSKILPDLRKLVSEALPKPTRTRRAGAGPTTVKRVGTTRPRKVATAVKK
jgi:hypothetical protein